MRILDLFETVRPSYLYHGTMIQYALGIVAEDRFEDRTIHEITPYLKVPSKYTFHDLVRGVSFTRDKRFARRWVGERGFIFVMDRDKMKQHGVRFMQIDYTEDRKEAEEFVIGPLEKMSRFLVSIELKQKAFDFYSKHTRSAYELRLMTHPLLHIV